MTTTIENQTAILADLWLNYKHDESFLDFVFYNDIGLPLAYALHNGIVEGTDLSSAFIVETFTLLVEACEVTDTGFESLDEMFPQQAE